MTAPTILTIDVGTSSLKAVLYTDAGRVLASAKSRYEYDIPQPGWAECDPADWWSALIEALAELGSKGHNLQAVSCLGVTGQMHTPVLLDGDGMPLTPTLLWLDQRAGAETKELCDHFNLPPYHINTTFTLPKLLWLKRHRPEILGDTRTLLWPKDYLRYRLTGRFMTDVTEGAGAGLLDWERRTWSEERASYVGLDMSVLPPLAAPDEDAGALLPEIARQLGLSPKARVIVGAGDVLALIGAAPPRVGRLTCSLGSSGMISSPLPDGQHVSDPDHRIYTNPFLHYSLLNAILSSSGACLTWAHSALYGSETAFAEMLAFARSTAPGADGLLFLPYLMGERSPYWNPDLRGTFYGLSLHHRRPHMIRAAMEGVAFSLRHIIEIAAELGIAIDEIALAGGGSTVAGWPQIFADVCQRPVVSYAGEETVTRPLYAHCRLALGNTESFSTLLANTFEEPHIYLLPQQSLSSTYTKLFRQYQSLADFAAGTLT
ncbi:MAG: hypothetical protein GY759_21645 [Chloroflexi bacterium]|nr:hypothetical protein [Chloroflexota bacterium]